MGGLSDAVQQLASSWRGSGETTMIPLVVGSLVGIWFTSALVSAAGNYRKVGHVEGMWRPFSPFTLGAMLPSTWYLNPGLILQWKYRKWIYKQFKNDIFGFFGFFTGDVFLYTNNLHVAQQVAGGAQSDFEKPLRYSISLLYWGINLVAAPGGAEWRKHRRIMGPAFSTKLNRLVWRRTAEIYREMLDAEGWHHKDVIELPATEKLTTKAALLVITGCGFGLKSHWSDPESTTNGKMTLQNAIHIFMNKQLLLNLPEWVRNLPFKTFRDYHEAADVMTEWMTKKTTERQDFIRNTTRLNDDSDDSADDCLSLLIAANEAEEEDVKYKLTTQELIGNLFVLLFAGHETTALAIASTLALLALHPEVQDEVLGQILSVVGYEKEPEFEDYGKLDKVLASFYEALRLVPPAYIMFRQATKDTIIHVPKSRDEEETIPVALPKGTIVIADLIGIQYNERYFDEPTKFKPSRWYGLPLDSEAFGGFSIGPRACMGRKFATYEAVIFLTMLLRDWKVEPLLKPGQTLKGWEDTFLNVTILITCAVKDVPIRFVRRKRM